MANFNTHLNVAVITTGLCSAALLSVGHIDLNSALGLWFLGVIGGLLPDIDSDNSTSLDTLFNLFSLGAVLITIRYITIIGGTQISLIELIVIPSIIYSIMKFLIRPLFEKITVHRGSCHSLLFLLLIALSTVQLIWILTPQTEKQSIVAWLSGGFIFLGGIVHLLLDELYSVDLSNVRIKRSFGTALKIADFKNRNITLATFIAIIALLYITPSVTETLNLLSNWSKFNFMPQYRN